jgi:hypothetical protein
MILKNHVFSVFRSYVGRAYKAGWRESNDAFWARREEYRGGPLPPGSVDRFLYFLLFHYYTCSTKKKEKKIRQMIRNYNANNDNVIVSGRKKINGNYHPYQNCRSPPDPAEYLRIIVNAHSNILKRILLLTFLLFLTVTIIVPFFVIHFGAIRIFPDNNLLRRPQQQQSHVVQPILAKGEPQRIIFGLDTPQLHEQLESSYTHYYDTIYKSNGKHDSYKDIRIHDFSSFTGTHLLI